MALSPVYNYNPISYQDILMGDSGLWDNVNQDEGGNNEVGRQARISAQALWPMLAQRLTQMGMMTPQIQQAIDRVTQALSPEGTQTLADEQYGRLQRKGQEAGDYRAGRLRSAGASTQAQEGARLAQMNASTEAGNDYMNELYSPAGIATRSGQLMDFNNNLANPLMQQLLQLGQFIEGRHQQNQSERSQGGLGGLLGIAGQLMGQGNPFGSMFKSTAPNPGVSSAAGMAGGGMGTGILGSSGGRFDDFDIFGSTPRFG